MKRAWFILEFILSAACVVAAVASVVKGDPAHIRLAYFLGGMFFLKAAVDDWKAYETAKAMVTLDQWLGRGPR